ncbi:MAG: undecaprenyldiphospho-muramoylpentapeptide beta-N-acetylglucosaminyltransferase [Coxiella burnetii]|nr:undecaprenyldiphospho-muramoylpentapeptide beta-N-acetylglucosaminyltransferase [Coxiella burnetii]
MNRILIIAGGTGGHIFPALAVARELREQEVDVQWLGVKGGLEEKLVPDSFPLHLIQIKAFRGKRGLQQLLMPLRLVRAVFQAYRIIRQFKPDVILGMGGYVAGPGGLAAWITRTPLIIHEQNSIPGLTNRVLAKMAKFILQGFPDTFPQNRKVITTGNPVRTELVKMPLPQVRLAARRGPLRILVLGGSQGARSINQKMLAALSSYPRSEEIAVWHQTGQRDFEFIQKEYEKIKIEAKVDNFISDMAGAYGWADLVVCRAGALTVCEIASVGVASIFIPYPHAVDNHQFHNARFLEQAGAAIIISEESLTETDLMRWFEQFAQDRDRLLTMAENGRKLAKPEAVQRVIAQCKKFYAAR